MKFMVALDFSDITDKVLQHSSELAKAMQAEVVLLHVAEPNPDHIAYDYDPAAISVIDPAEIRNSVAQKFHANHQKLQQYSEGLRQQGIDCKGLMVQGPTVETLLKEMDKLKVDFIVAGSHAKGMISQILLGSISEALVKKTRIPVYLVPNDRD